CTQPFLNPRVIAGHQRTAILAGCEHHVDDHGLALDQIGVEMPLDAVLVYQHSVGKVALRGSLLSILRLAGRKSCERDDGSRQDVKSHKQTSRDASMPNIMAQFDHKC